MPRLLGVWRVDDASVKFYSLPGGSYVGNFISTKRNKAADMKRFIAEKTGVPPQRQVFHIYRGGGKFEASPFLENDDDNLKRALAAVKNENLGRTVFISVRYLPEHAALDADGDTNRVVLEVNATEERIACDRANIIEVYDDEPEERPVKRPRVVKKEDTDGKGDIGGDTEDREKRAAVKSEDDTAGGGGEEDGDPDQGDVDRTQEQNNRAAAAAAWADAVAVKIEDEDLYGDQAGDAANGNGIAGADENEVAADPFPLPSEFRLWLRGLDNVDKTVDRFEKFAPAFEQEFGCLRHVAIVADQGREDEIFTTCGVTAIGDRGVIRDAITLIPRTTD